MEIDNSDFLSAGGAEQSIVASCFDHGDTLLRNGGGDQRLIELTATVADQFDDPLGILPVLSQSSQSTRQSVHRTSALGAAEEGSRVISVNDRTQLLAGTSHLARLAQNNSVGFIHQMLGHSMTAQTDSTIPLLWAGTKFVVLLQNSV